MVDIGEKIFEGGSFLDNYANYPVLIGATGGSGTRIFAKICIDVGIYMGAKLNESLDSLSFYDFYNFWINKSWNRNQFDNDQTAQRDKDFRQCVADHRAAIPHTNARWGWKGPRSMFLVELFYKHYPGLKFIHVVRDGRDMAYSENQNQLHAHGQVLLGMQFGNLRKPYCSILLWNVINRSVAKFGESVMGDRYLRIRFEDICTKPVLTGRLLIDFLGCHDADVRALTHSVRVPVSIGRWRLQPQEEIEKLEELGGISLKYFGYI